MVLNQDLGRLDRGCGFTVGVVRAYLGFASRGETTNALITRLLGLLGLITLCAFVAGSCPAYARCELSTRWPQISKNDP